MYQALLTRRYLIRRVMPLLAALGVAVSTWLVLISWSVMGGFLDTLLNSGRTMIGDVKISWPNAGFPHYEDLLERLEAEDDIVAASPMIETMCVIVLPDDRVEMLQVVGIEPASFAQVTSYHDALWWKPLDEPMPRDKERDDPRLRDKEQWAEMYENGKTLTRPDPETGEPIPAVVLGIEVTDYNERLPSGVRRPWMPRKRMPDGSTPMLSVVMMVNGDVMLHVVPLDQSGRSIEMVTRVLPVANEFESGIFEIDRRTVLMPLHVLQAMLLMDEAERVEMPAGAWGLVENPETGELEPAKPVVVGRDPARVTSVIVKGVEGLEASEVRETCKRVWGEFAAAHPGEVPELERISISTWEDLNRSIIAAVKKETGLVLFLFGAMSLVTVFLILSIFWSIVAEKTKDVGVLRSMGASRSGIAWLWVRYGLAIGVVGSALGMVLGYATVWNINPLHEFIGKVTGTYIWDPSIYYFSEIPNEVDTVHAAIVAVSFILVSGIGAIVPATRAALMDPVKALRFE